MFIFVLYWIVLEPKWNINISAIPCDYFLYMWIFVYIFWHVVRENKTSGAVATHGHSTSCTKLATITMDRGV
jgi:hypothetical protein